MRAKRVVQTASLGPVVLVAEVRRFDAGIELSAHVERARLDELGNRYNDKAPPLFGAVPCPQGDMTASEAWSWNSSIGGVHAVRALGAVDPAECATRMGELAAEAAGYDALIASLQASATTILASLEAELQAGASAAGWTVGGA